MRLVELMRLVGLVRPIWLIFLSWDWLVENGMIAGSKILALILYVYITILSIFEKYKTNARNK
jgi:hypothetical protein